MARPEPVDAVEDHLPGGEAFARSDNDVPIGRIEPQHVERLAAGDAETLALADREMDDAVMPSEHASRLVDDIAWLDCAGPQLCNECVIASARHEADVLAVGLLRHRQRKARRQRAGFIFAQFAEREAQEIELLARRAIEEIALVAAGIGGAVQLRPGGAVDAARIVAGRERVRAEVARDGEQIVELHRFVAANARHRRLAGDVGIGEFVDHRGAKALLVIEHVMGNAERLGDPRRVVDVLPGAARALAAGCLAVVVKLQRHADDVITAFDQQRRHGRAVDAARHGDDHPRAGSERHIHQVLIILRVTCGRRTTRPSSSSVITIWQPRREVLVRPKARSSMSSSSSVASFSSSYHSGSTITWQVEQANEPSQAPSMSTSFWCAISSTDRPTGASTVLRVPSRSIKVILGIYDSNPSSRQAQGAVIPACGAKSSAIRAAPSAAASTAVSPPAAACRVTTRSTARLAT